MASRAAGTNCAYEITAQRGKYQLSWHYARTKSQAHSTTERWRSRGTASQLPSVSNSAVFRFLKDTRDTLTWKLRDFQVCLNIGAKDAKQILAILQIQGYAQQQEDTDEYLTTASGEAVSGSKLPRMKRESVEEALSTIAERIAAINRDPRAKFSIRKAVAFGDFLSKRPQVQAPDVGVMLTRRAPVSGNEINDKEEQDFLKQLQAKNRFIRVQRYQPWMSERTHRKLL